MVWHVNLSQDEITFLMECGHLCREAKRFEEAKNIFSGARALLPQSDVPEVALGTVHFAESNFDEAIKHYNRALKKNPKSAYAYVHLGEAYLFKTNKEKAREFLKKAVQLDLKGDLGKVARMLLELTEQITFR